MGGCEIATLKVDAPLDRHAVDSNVSTGGKILEWHRGISSYKNYLSWREENHPNENSLPKMDGGLMRGM
jgi:hypothetical protein